jgi:hypothetical protein
MEDGAVHLTRYSLHQQNRPQAQAQGPSAHHPLAHPLPQIKQTKTSKIRTENNLKSKQKLILKRTDSTDDSNCHQIHSTSHHNLHFHSSSKSSSRSGAKDDHDLKIKRKFSLPSVSSATFDNIFNGHTIFWKLKLPAQVSLFHHVEFDCLEISVFDLNRHQEMERLYVSASHLFEILEDLVELSEYKDRKVSLSEVIKAARLNAAIDFIMSHLGCEKISFMPPVATLRYYNGLVLPPPLSLSLSGSLSLSLSLSMSLCLSVSVCLSLSLCLSLSVSLSLCFSLCLCLSLSLLHSLSLSLSLLVSPSSPSPLLLSPSSQRSSIRSKRCRS